MAKPPLRHCEPTGRANARPMTGSAKQSTAARKNWIASSQGLLAMTLMTMLQPPPSYPPPGRANARPMTGSGGYPVRRDLSFPSLTPRNTGSSAFADDDERRPSRDTLRPRFANSFAPKGRREDRVRAAPAVPCAKVDKKTHTSIQVQRRQSGLPCAMALRLISCSPRRDRACLSPSSPRSVSFSRT